MLAHTLPNLHACTLAGECKHSGLNYVHSSPSLSPALLDQLQSSTAEVKRKLSPEEGG